MPDEIKPLYPINGKDDPTGNVLLLVAAAVTRQDDLREAERRYNDLRSQHSREMQTLTAGHQNELNAKESSRLDSIRQVDREEVNKSAITAQTAITTLANSTVALKDTLQNQVQTTAVALENKQQIFQSDVNKRLSNLELQYSEGKGKSDVREPANDELVKLVRDMAAQNSQGQGKSVGVDKTVGWLVAGIAILIAAASYFSR